jgi:hypothetical protein
VIGGPGSLQSVLNPAGLTRSLLTTYGVFCRNKCHLNERLYIFAAYDFRFRAEATGRLLFIN